MSLTFSQLQQQMASSFNRQSQHKPPKDRISGKEVAELKKQLKQARRMVSRLQKEVGYLKNKLGEETIPEFEPDPEPPEQTVEQVKGCCESPDLAIFPLPSQKNMVFCKNCGNRETR
jgi:hypothetical protein